ncbi:MAG: hypothetical protein JOS17DRAFT_732105 [Linnemannia elongata]|nr:MAG: hypothetical protein JOS17DRAFT_732105 [Linnemannia elongata]
MPAHTRSSPSSAGPPSQQTRHAVREKRKLMGAVPMFSLNEGRTGYAKRARTAKKSTSNTKGISFTAPSPTKPTEPSRNTTATATATATTTSGTATATTTTTTATATTATTTATSKATAATSKAATTKLTAKATRPKATTKATTRTTKATTIATKAVTAGATTKTRQRKSRLTAKANASPVSQVNAIEDMDVVEARKQSANSILTGLLEMENPSKTLQHYRTYMRLWKVSL